MLRDTVQLTPSRRRGAAIATAAVLAVVSAVIVGPYPKRTFAAASRCDLNNDGNVTVGDVQVLINMVLGVTTPTPQADLNGDGTVSVADVQVMINVALGVATCPQGGGGAALPSQSSSIAVSPDGTFLVNVNPDVNTVSLYRLAPQVIKYAEVPVGNNPTSVVIDPRNLAYVANAGDGTVSVVNVASSFVATTYSVGAGPMAVALSPSGGTLYVANSASNNLMAIDTSSGAKKATVDLSPFGTEPRAVAVTNTGSGADSDQTVFVAMFFAQLRPGKTFLDEGQDDQREGRVVAIAASNNTPLAAPNPIVLAPMANTGFNSNGQLAPGGSGSALAPAVASTNPQTFITPTAAYPNQLASIAIHPNNQKAYVVSTAASPNGPLRFNQMVQGLVSVFDTTSRLELTATQTDSSVRRTAPLNLNQGINLGTTPAPRLFLSNPVAMAWRPNGSDAWVVIQNSDLIVRLTVDGSGTPTVNNPLAAGPSSLVRVDLQSVGTGQIAGNAPRGIAINSSGTNAYVYNFVSRSVTTVDISNATAPAIVNTTQASPLPAPGTPDATAQLGAEFFFTGRGPDGRMSQESWGGCITCHPAGLSDNVTWMFDAGPRQTIPLDSTFSKTDPSDQRILNWSAVRDEVHDFELNTRGVFNGRGLIDEDRLFFAIAGASGTPPTDTALITQFQQFTGAVGATNDFTNTTIPTSLGARRDFGVATLDDARVFIIGGRTGAGAGSLVGSSAAVMEFNPRTNTLTAKSPNGFTPRHSLGAAAVRTAAGNRIYAIGGYSSTSSSALPVATVEEYNPDLNTWRTVASLPTAVADFGIAVAGGINTAEPLQLIHVVSGNTGSESAPNVTNPNPVQRFQADPAASGTWSSFNPPGLTLRLNHGAATALRGVQSRIFVIGGQDASGNVLSTVEEYQAQAVTVVTSTHTAVPVPRAHFGIGSTLSSNQIYVIGGIDNTGADQATVLEYTPAVNGAVAGPAGAPSGAWATRAGLPSARHGLGVNSPPSVTNFLPLKSSGRDARQDAISAWVAAKVFPSRAPVAASDALAQTGRTLFGSVGLVVAGFSCATCHGGPKWTRSTVDYPAPPSPEVGLGLGNQRVIGAELRQTASQGPNAGQFPGVLINVGTFAANSSGGRVNEIRTNPADVSQTVAPLGANGFNIPSLLSVHETAPYFYNGLATKLENVLDGSQDGNGGVRHHFVASPTQRAALLQFLKSIDQTTPIFP